MAHAGKQAKCPRCASGPLEGCTFEGNALSVCTRCGGLWCDAGRWNEAALGPRPAMPGEGDGIYFVEVAGLDCPGCRAGMSAVRIQEIDGLTIDVCGTCGGVWFDRGEWENMEAVRQWQAQRARVERKTTWGDWFFQFFLQLPIEFNIAPRRTPIVTLTIIAICFIVQLAQLYTGEQAMIDWAGTRGMESFTLAGLATLVTHLFVHGGWLHLLGNMYLLYVLGDNVEDVMGRAGYALFYLTCGIVAASAEIAVSAAFDVEIPLVGASGAIAGVIAAYLVLCRRARLTFMLIFWQFKAPAFVWIGVWLLIQAAAFALDPTGAVFGVAWMAHLGGFACGLAITLPLRHWLVSRYHLLALLDRHAIRVRRSR
jgi:membrane associated rhomboid family serine protease